MCLFWYLYLWFRGWQKFRSACTSLKRSSRRARSQWWGNCRGNIWRVAYIVLDTICLYFSLNGSLLMIWLQDFQIILLGNNNYKMEKSNSIHGKFFSGHQGLWFCKLQTRSIKNIWSSILSNTAIIFLFVKYNHYIFPYFAWILFKILFKFCNLHSVMLPF